MRPGEEKSMFNNQRYVTRGMANLQFTSALTLLTKFTCIFTKIPTLSWGIPEWRPRVTSWITATTTRFPEW